MSWSLLMLSNAIIIHIFLSTQSLDNYPDEVLHGSGRNMPRHESTKRSMTIKRTIRIITKHFQMDVLNLIAGYFGGRFSLTLYRWGFLHTWNSWWKKHVINPQPECFGHFGVRIPCLFTNFAGPATWKNKSSTNGPEEKHMFHPSGRKLLMELSSLTTIWDEN